MLSSHVSVWMSKVCWCYFLYSFVFLSSKFCCTIHRCLISSPCQYGRCQNSIESVDVLRTRIEIRQMCKEWSFSKLYVKFQQSIWGIFYIILSWIFPFIVYIIRFVFSYDKAVFESNFGLMYLHHDYYIVTDHHSYALKK